MRNLFICCDGTWNTPTELQDGVAVPTNVHKFYAALAENGKGKVPQLRYYHPGVGTEGGHLRRVMDGALGGGLDGNVKSAYKWLCDVYQDDDRIFLIGFSRGSYTVRSLAGFISRCGILKNVTWNGLDDLYTQYLDGKLTKHSKQPIYFIGVWDTVGALGIPLKLTWLAARIVRRHQFHDVKLAPTVQHAFHAVAIDEQRDDFTPTLWQGPFGNQQVVKQVWFPGVHSDVGGGYKEDGLSDGAFEWMLGNAARCGAGFNRDLVRQIKPNHQGVLHDSFQGVYTLLGCQPRSMPYIDWKSPGPDIHASALNRQEDPPIQQVPYRKSVHLKPGQSITVDIYASEAWNWTSVYCLPGEIYSFAARGDWMHAGRAIGARGIGWGLCALWHIFNKRNLRARWFELVGSLGDAGNPDQNGIPAPMSQFVIGDGVARYTIPNGKGGYLYCFANDKRERGGVNRGSLEVTIMRV
ncbi:MAG TPA: DUF2235 domain-containing protein [Terracidiphilus sp.]|nr:DUF2235 domain-containing protein [Terracidiphilus sp.]